MQKMIILFLLMMMICPSSAEPITVNNVSTMAELLTAVNNTSIIEVSDGYYTVYEAINITTPIFTITEDTRIDTFAFIDFNSSVEAQSKTITGFESGRKRRTDNRYIESGYIIIRGNLTMDDMYVHSLGSEYRAARYNNGITVYGNSNVTDSIFEYVKRFVVISETEAVLIHYKDTSYWKTQFTKTTNTFNDSTFKRADVVVYNSINVSLNDCELTNSRISVHNYGNSDPNGVHINSCTLTDTNDRQDGDGHYSGVNGYWANMFVSDSALYDCDIRAGDRPAMIDNCTLTDGDIVLGSARKSSVTDSTLRGGSILISGSAEKIQIRGNDISGDFYGIRIGTRSIYGTSSIAQLDVHDNEIRNTTQGIAILNAYATTHTAQIHDNTVQDSDVALYTHGYSTHNRHRNTVHGNTFNGSVMINGAVKDFYDNQITETLSITDATGYMSVTDSTAKNANTTNSIDTTFDSCTIGMYNFFNDSNDNLIISNHMVNATTDTTITNLSVSNSTYVFNGSTHLSSSDMNFTVHSGALAEVSVSDLNGAYDLLFDGSTFVENVSTVDSVLTFACSMLPGNYTIIEHIEQAEPTSAHPSDAHRSDSSAGARYWQSVRNANANADIENKTNNAQQNKIHDEINNTHVRKYLVEKETTGMVKRETAKRETTTERIMNWIRNLFKF